MEESKELTGELFDYDDDLALEGQSRSIVQRVKQTFDPRNLASQIIFEFRKLCNSEIDVEDYQKSFNLNYNKIICFKK